MGRTFKFSTKSLVEELNPQIDIDANGQQG